MKLRLNFGFTLIELLVVVAIISLLSSIILTSLKSARIKGADGAIKSQLLSFKTQAALYYSLHNDTYGPATTGNCDINMFADSAIDPMITNLYNLAGNNWYNCFTSPSAPTTSWVVIVRSSSGGAQYWCADSTGVLVSEAGGTITPSGNTVTCP